MGTVIHFALARILRELRDAAEVGVRGVQAMHRGSRQSEEARQCAAAGRLKPPQRRTKNAQRTQPRAPAGASSQT